MRNVQGIGLGVAVAALMTACAAPPPPPMAAAPAPAVTAAAPMAGGLDGTYRSPTGPVSGNARCGTTKFGYPIKVVGGVASLASVVNGTLEGPVGPDGSLAIEKGRAGLHGQFADGRFNGTYGSGGGCTFTLAYIKR